jgi:hypothetical protein
VKTPKHRARSKQSAENTERSALANSFMMMPVVPSLYAFVFRIAELQNLLADGRSLIRPVSIDDIITSSSHDSAIDLLKDLRHALSGMSGGSEKAAAEAVCQIGFEFVERLNCLADSRALGDAPKRLRAWPINFAPGASEGASKMKEGVSLFEGLGVGSEALITAGPRTRAGTARKGKGGWRDETEAAIKAAVLNAQWLIPFHRLRRKSKPLRTAECVHPRMKARFLVQRFETPGSRLLLWPWWMDELLPLTKTNPATGLPFLERLDGQSVDLFMPVIEGLFLWRAIFGKSLRQMQSKVVDRNEGGAIELVKFQPELIGKVLTGVRHTLLALAGRGRSGRTRKKRSRK